MCDMTHSHVWHDACICVTWPTHTCAMTHSYVGHDSFIGVPQLIHMCAMTHAYVWHECAIAQGTDVCGRETQREKESEQISEASSLPIFFLICKLTAELTLKINSSWNILRILVYSSEYLENLFFIPMRIFWDFFWNPLRRGFGRPAPPKFATSEGLWLIHMCDVTHSYVWHDSLVCVTWPIHMCDMTHSHVCHNSCICVTWLIHMCDMTHGAKGRYRWRSMTHDSWLMAHDSWRQRSLQVEVYDS